MGEEARTGKRFPLELPIKIHKGDTGGDAAGITGNLSAAGVYIRADSSMEIGSPVEFEITLPPEMTGGQENVTIQCKGRVVRADRNWRRRRRPRCGLRDRLIRVREELLTF